MRLHRWIQCLYHHRKKNSQWQLVCRPYRLRTSGQSLCRFKSFLVVSVQNARSFFLLMHTALIQSQDRNYRGQDLLHRVLEVNRQHILQRLNLPRWHAHELLASLLGTKSLSDWAYHAKAPSQQLPPKFLVELLYELNQFHLWIMRSHQTQIWI